jgi:hypothetical protein
MNPGRGFHWQDGGSAVTYVRQPTDIVRRVRELERQSLNHTVEGSAGSSDGGGISWYEPQSGLYMVIGQFEIGGRVANGFVATDAGGTPTVWSYVYADTGEVSFSAGPKGDPGPAGPAGASAAAATVGVRSTATGAPGTNAAVTNVGTSTAALLDFVIPQGAAGPGVLPGGAAGQPLVKIDGASFNTRWGGDVSVGAVTASGSVSTTAEDRGLFFMNGTGGAVYKKSAGGLTLRESSGGQQPVIEDNNGTNPRQILDMANAPGLLIDVDVRAVLGPFPQSVTVTLPFKADVLIDLHATCYAVTTLPNVTGAGLSVQWDGTALPNRAGRWWAALVEHDHVGTHNVVRDAAAGAHTIRIIHNHANITSNSNDQAHIGLTYVRVP